MKTFYRLSNSAGLIRSNTFHEKVDAICVATYRAEQLGLPIKIYEHSDTTGADGICVLVCQPDGSAKAPVGAGKEVVDLGNAPGAENRSEAYMLLSAYDEMPMTTYYLKSDLAEAMAGSIEKELGVELGLYDPKTLHAYTEDASKLKAIEGKLAEASVEIERVKDSKARKEKLQAATELVEAARKGHVAARASRMPEISIRASQRFGSGLRVQCHCELVQAGKNEQPKIRVYADGRSIGEVRDEREASAAIAEYVTRSVQKFIRKELA